jgi:hypothetical protein
MSKTARSSR